MFGKAPEPEALKPLEIRPTKFNSKGVCTKFVFVVPCKYTSMKLRKIKDNIGAYFVGAGYH
ncbi:hypothetical protein MA9V2_105 [Chryseobacterium phage MA9V-2]|nr:hypothetical protein MA9V2_105 [Chryseobacterium phage MA9V-2]